MTEAFLKGLTEGYMSKKAAEETSGGVADHVGRIGTGVATGALTGLAAHALGGTHDPYDIAQSLAAAGGAGLGSAAIYPYLKDLLTGGGKGVDAIKDQDTTALLESLGTAGAMGLASNFPLRNAATAAIRSQLPDMNTAKAVFGGGRVASDYPLAVQEWAKNLGVDVTSLPLHT